jgi:hypothetical protein
MSEEFPEEAAAFRQLLQADANEPVAGRLDAGVTRRRLRNQRLARGGAMAVGVVAIATAFALVSWGGTPQPTVVGIPSQTVSASPTPSDSSSTPTATSSELWQRIADRPADAAASGAWIAGDFYSLDLADGGKLLRGYAYDPESDAWQALPDLQISITAEDSYIAEADGAVYVLLTTDADSGKPIASVLARYDIAGGSWTQDAGPTFSSTILPWLYAVGQGLVADDARTYWYYDPGRGEWQEFPEPVHRENLGLVDPATGQVVRTIEWTARCRPESPDFVTQLDGEDYLVIQSSDPDDKTICRYDLAKNTWEELPVPDGVFNVNNGEWLMYGYLAPDELPQLSRTLLESGDNLYDPVGNTWYTVGELPDPVVSGAPFEPLDWQVETIGQDVIMVCLREPSWTWQVVGYPEYKEYSVPSGLENACYLAHPDVAGMLREYHAGDAESDPITVEVTLGAEYPDPDCTLDGGSCRYVHIKTSGLPENVRTACKLRVDDPRYEVPEGERQTEGFGVWYWVGDNDRDIDNTVVPILVTDTTENIHARCGQTEVDIEP